MIQFRRLGYIFFLFIILSACGDGWLSRQWHNTTSHYNIYFNAEQDWNKTVLALREGNKDDFRGFIELYNYGSAEGLKSNQGAMDEVVKKVSTMIDKHPKSRWVDDAYLLMGKAYFMKGDFIAAKDIFEYVISNFKDPKVVYSAKLWIFQSLYYQGKYAEAESLATSLKGDKEFPTSLNAELYKALGAVMLHNNKIPQAAEYLSQSLKTTKGKMERYRMHFALGQALQKTEKYDEAVQQYVKVVKMTPPYELAFNSRINQVEILSLQKRDYAKANKLLRRMLKDDKNIEYYAEIYHKMGVNELRAGNTGKGLAYLNQSLRESTSNNAQKTTTYLTIGDFYYGIRNFEQSALYYDSANMILDEKHPDYESISKKSLKLSELLRHLLVIKKQDSLMRLAKDPVLREKTIDRLIEIQKQKELNAKNQAPSAPSNVPLPGGSGPTPQGNSAFPFYNMNQRNRGITDFQSKWGERTNRDFWNINSKKVQSSGAAGDGNTNNPDDTLQNENPAATADENRKKYYKEIPLTPALQEQSLAKIEEAIFAAAGVYQNGFNEYDQAIFYYKELLRRFPQSKYHAQSLYELAKMYKAKGENSLYAQYRKELEDKHPESIYVKLLDDPNAAKNIGKGGSAKKEIEELYEKMYAFYQSANYVEAIALKKDVDSKFAGNSFQAKFDLLGGICEIKNKQEEIGIAHLKQIMEDYPNTAEAKRAEEIVQAWDLRNSPQPSVNTDGSDTTTGEVKGLWKAWDTKEELYFILTYPRGGNSNLIRAALNDYNKENYVFETLEVSAAAAVGETIYITVSNFSKPEIAQEYVKMMMNKGDFFASRGLFEFEVAWISKTNYKTLSTNNRINSYIDFYKTGNK